MEVERRSRLRGGADAGPPASPSRAVRVGAAEQPRSEPEFRARQLRARELLRGDLEGRDLEQVVEEGVLTTTLEKGLNVARSNSVFPATFGLACCAIEMMSIVSARTDIARFGAEALRASPRQADLLILSGRVSIKMVPVVRRLYDQMLEPKWVIAMGACSSSGGMFANYAVVQGADKFMPVDVHVPGCPPRPEALMHGFNRLQHKIKSGPELGWRRRYNAIGTEEWARFESGEPAPEAIEAAARAVAASGSAPDERALEDAERERAEADAPAAASPGASAAEPGSSGNGGR